MHQSRRKFIKTSGIVVLGSGILIHPSCRSKPSDDLKALILDYIGPHTHYLDITSLFSETKKIELAESTLEQSVYGSSQLAFVCKPLTSRAAVTMMLLEQGKDVLVLPPLAGSFEEFDAIQRTCNQLDRRMALLNPLHYLPAVTKLRELIGSGAAGRISHAEIRINPAYSYPLIPGIEGILGPGIFHVQLINELTSAWPLFVEVKETDSEIAAPGDATVELEFGYRQMILAYRPVYAAQGWELRITAEKESFLLDDTGLLQSGSLDILVPAEKHCMVDSMKKSVNNFIDSVRTWKEPESNSVEGLMQLSLNTFVSAAVQTGERIKMAEEDETV